MGYGVGGCDDLIGIDIRTCQKPVGKIDCMIETLISAAITRVLISAAITRVGLRIVLVVMGNQRMPSGIGVNNRAAIVDDIQERSFASRPIIGREVSRDEIAFRPFCLSGMPSTRDDGIGGYSSCFGGTQNRPASIASTAFIARKVFPSASGKPGGVLSAPVRQSWSKRGPMLAGRWISSTISLPAADASAFSTSSTM
jgi:hypothetical protein